jgi:ankyrin repeat protein
MLRYTILHTLAANGNIEMLKFLIELQPNLAEIKDTQGQTPLFSAVKYGKIEAIRCLLEKKANAYQRDCEGRSCMHYAAAKGQLDVINALVEYHQRQDESTSSLKNKSKGEDDGNDSDGSDYSQNSVARLVDITDSKHGQTPLFSAIKYVTVVQRLTSGRYRKIEAVKYLVDKLHANVNSRDYMRETPLHHAAKSGLKSIVEFLLDNGARTDLENKDGQLAVDVAASGKGIRSLLNRVTIQNKRKQDEVILPDSSRDGVDDDNIETDTKRVRLSNEGIEDEDDLLLPNDAEEDKTLAYSTPQP